MYYSSTLFRTEILSYFLTNIKIQSKVYDDYSTDPIAYCLQLQPEILLDLVNQKQYCAMECEQTRLNQNINPDDQSCIGTRSLCKPFSTTDDNIDIIIVCKTYKRMFY